MEKKRDISEMIFNFTITWILMRSPILFTICYGLYHDFNSKGLSLFAGVVVVVLLVIMDRQLKIKELLEKINDNNK